MQNRITSLLDFQLDRDPFGRLVLTLPDGRRHVGVTPIRGFPISDPSHGLSLCDAEGREVTWIEDPSQLPAAVREILESELRDREFLPQIHRILSISMQTDPCEWEVETDRGLTTFLLKSEDDVLRLGNNRAMIIDAHGIRYLIPDTAALDRATRRILERYL